MRRFLNEVEMMKFCCVSNCVTLTIAEKATPSICRWPSLPLLFSARVCAATQLLTHEFYRLQASSEKQLAELQAQNAEQASRLETYEKLEQELDQVTVQAAQSKSADPTGFGRPPQHSHYSRCWNVKNSRHSGRGRSRWLCGCLLTFFVIVSKWKKL